MDKYKIILFIVCFTASMNLSGSNLPTYTVRGHLVNFDSKDYEDITITATKVLPDGQRTLNVEIDEDGTFEFEGTSYKELNQIWLRIGEFYYGEILVSKDLEIKLDGRKLRKSGLYFYGKGVSFLGHDGDATTLANRWTKFNRKQQLKFHSKLQGVVYSQEDFSQKKEQLNAIYSRLEEIESKFLSENKSELAWILEDKRKSEYYGQLFQIADRKNVEWALFEDALDYCPKILGNAGHSYFRMQGWLLSRIYIGSNIKDHWIDLKKHLPKAKEENRDFVVIAAVPNRLEYKEEFISKFLPELSEDWGKDFMERRLSISQGRTESITEELKKAKALSKNNKMGSAHKSLSLGADLYISMEEDPKRFLADLLSNFEGKAVIIDIWATWCGPCIDDMKKSKEVKAELKDLALEIIYVCTESKSSINTWERKIVETESTGKHIYISTKLSNALFEEYGLSGYPSYLFFDKTGKYKEGAVERISILDTEKMKQLLR